MHDHGGSAGGDPALLVAVPLAIAVTLYLGGAVADRRRGGAWPVRRDVAFAAGVALLAGCIVVPLAAREHSLAIHVVVAVLAGGVTPALVALAAPLDLALRTLAPVPARRLRALLAGRAGRIALHPAWTVTVHLGSIATVFGTPLVEGLALPAGHVLFTAWIAGTGTAAAESIRRRAPGEGRRAAALLTPR